jgi:hypothetical protein
MRMAARRRKAAAGVTTLLLRTHSWMNRFRGLVVRWEKRIANCEGSLHLACASPLPEPAYWNRSQPDGAVHVREGEPYERDRVYSARSASVG